MTRIIPWLAMALSAVAVAIAFSSGSAPSPSEDGVSRKELFAVRDRLDALEATVDAMVDKLDDGSGSIARRKVAQDVFKAPEDDGREKGVAVDDGASRRQLEAMNQELANLRRQVKDLESAPKSADGENPEFKNAVANAQRELRQERMREFHQRMEQDRLESMEEFVQAEGLTAAQADDLRRIIGNDMEYIREAMSMTDENGLRLTRNERREKMTAHREALKGDLEQVMTVEQADKFMRDVMSPTPGMPPPPRRVESP